MKKIYFGGIFVENKTGYRLVISNVKMNNLKTILFNQKVCWIQNDFRIEKPMAK